MPASSYQQKALILALVLFSLLSFFFNLGQRSLWEPDEGRYAEISREMVETGDWLTPRLNYIKHFDKPPLTYWLIGSSIRLFGLNEFAAHLPLVLLGLAGILATYYLGRALFTADVGILAALILTTSLGYPAISRVVSTDIVFTFFCILCYLFFVRKNFLLFFLCLGLGFMTKGPVVFVIVVLPICAFLLYEAEKHSFRQIPWIPGTVIFALVGLSWFVYQIWLHPGLLQDWFFQQTLDRVVGKSAQPFYFFIPVLAGMFFPWIFFLGPALRQQLSFKKTPADPESAKIRLLFLWFIIPFLFFCIIGKKLVPYILPLLPPLAIITGRFWQSVFADPKSIATKIFTVCRFLLLLTLPVIGLAMLVFLLLEFDNQLGIEATRANIIIISIILFLSTAASLLSFKFKKAKGLFWILAITSLFFFLTVVELLPKIEDDVNKSVKRLAIAIKRDLRPEDKIVNYRCFLKSLPFYLQRRTITVERERNLAYEQTQHWQDYLLKDKNQMYQLLKKQEHKVYCLTYTWEFKEIKKEFTQPLYLLDQAGKYVLFVNKALAGEAAK